MAKNPVITDIKQLQTQLHMCQDKMEQILVDYTTGNADLANKRLEMVIASLNNHAVFGRTLAISTGHPYAEENLEEIIEATHPVEIGFTGNGWFLLRLEPLDSIRYSTVKDKVFPEEIFAEPLRILLTMLCYHKDSLPQGAPSSPAITNIILYEYDEQMGQWCRERGISYTRYCDDMTFSGDFNPAEVIQFVKLELKKMGFLLNEQKTRIQHSGQRQTVTGIVVNEKLSIPVDYRRQLRQEIYYCKKFGIQEHLQRTGLETPEDTYRMQLLGKVNYVLNVHPYDKDMLDAKKWLQKASKI